MGEDWTKTQYSPALSGRQSENTAPELSLRSALHQLGFRFRTHWRIPGTRLTADVVLPKYRTVVQCYGCFWHSHAGCKLSGGPITGPNKTTWEEKFRRVREREERASAALAAIGYRLIVAWECNIRKNPTEEAAKIAAIIEES